MKIFIYLFFCLSISVCNRCAKKHENVAETGGTPEQGAPNSPQPPRNNGDPQKLQQERDSAINGLVNHRNTLMDRNIFEKG